MNFLHQIRFFLVALLLPVNVYAQLQECDRLAASPFDPQKQTAGLSFDKINPNLAIPACKKATEDNPQIARLWFQYGRALEKGNKLPDAIYAYQVAAKLKSGAAFNNIGELYRDGKGFQKDLNKATEYFTLAANLNSPEGRSNLSALQAQQKKVGSQQNIEALMDKCFDRKVAEERQRGGSVLGTMIPALLGACKTEIDAEGIGASSGSNIAAATSPSFDCRKATTPVEKLICTHPELSRLDVSLAETYKEAVSKDRSVRDDQRAWNREKNKCADVDCLKNAYEDRISELTNFIVRYDRAALNQGQTSASASNDGGVRSGLDFLFKQGGYWVVDETRPGQSCSSVLALEKFAQGFKRYSANQTEILTRIGGQHTAKNDPSVAARLNITINVPTQYVAIGNSPNTKIKVITGYPNGAIIEELLELSPSNNTVVKYDVGNCSNCDQAQLRSHQNFSGPRVWSWCNGNIGGASQTQPQTNARPSTPSVSNNLSQPQAQASPQRTLSLAERTAIQLGPETNAMCLLLSFRWIGLSLEPEATNFRNGLIRYAEVFTGLSKFQNESQFTAAFNSNKERVKQASFQNISDYFGNNCMKPEVKQLANSGWK